MLLNNSCLCRSQAKISKFQMWLSGATAPQALVLGRNKVLYSPNMRHMRAASTTPGTSQLDNLDRMIIQHNKGGTTKLYRQGLRLECCTSPPECLQAAPGLHGEPKPGLKARLCLLGTPSYLGAPLDPESSSLLPLLLSQAASMRLPLTLAAHRPLHHTVHIHSGVCPACSFAADAVNSALRCEARGHERGKAAKRSHFLFVMLHVAQLQSWRSCKLAE